MFCKVKILLAKIKGLQSYEKYDKKNRITTIILPKNILPNNFKDNQLIINNKFSNK